MILESLLVYTTGTFLLLYGLKSFIAGLNNEKKAYWMVLGYTQGLKKLLKENYDRVINTVGGAISSICGIIILLFY
jgi:hypothetical protein